MTGPAPPEGSPVVGLDIDRLGDYLRRRITGLSGDMRVRPIPGGQSNPTFFVDFPGRRLVLRKQPAGVTVPTAHAVDREFRIQSALGGSGVPVPRMVLEEADASILGTRFYVMERLDGRVLHDSALTALAHEERGAVYRSLAATLASLHAVDWKVAGLADYGRPGSYFARQIRRWTRQWETTRTRDISDIDALAQWLSCNIPEDDRTTIVHGDYRVGNVMLDATAPKIIGVLDWELSTLGHPFADLAHAQTMWFIEPDEYGGVRGLNLSRHGLPSRRAFEDQYLRDAGLAEGLMPFHLAFALFRFALIFEGVAARAQAGNAAAANAEEVGRLSIVLARRATEVLSGDPSW